MKNLFLLIIIASLGGYGYHWYQKKEDEKIVHPIQNPVYSETRVKIHADTMDLDAVIYVETLDEADCVEKQKELFTGISSACGRDCTLQKNSCYKNLPPRYQHIFENEPTTLTYLRATRGRPEEREIRIIYWGLTVEQSDQICKATPLFQKFLVGEVSCVLAHR